MTSEFMGLATIALVSSSLVAWITHVVWIIAALASSGGATGGQIALGLMGAFMPPVGVVHGFMVLFGFGF